MCRLLVDCRALNAACLDAPLYHYDSCPSQLDMFRKITRADYKFPRKFTDPEKEFVQKLLQIDHTKRLGIHVHNGCQQIKALPYFQNIDWAAMRLAKVGPSPIFRVLPCPPLQSSLRANPALLSCTRTDQVSLRDFREGPGRCEQL